MDNADADAADCGDAASSTCTGGWTCVTCGSRATWSRNARTAWTSASLNAAADCTTTSIGEAVPGPNCSLIVS